ncbi:30S ribosomal protein S15 [compost metagenome]|uniref:Small ribosomal subunit protein uS15 n=1 Tax=Pedobacter xixiisoli TaxID=1476464 RepID=A0A285ZX69_9SPHI|nr:30S ribosomal protein S15 [Pedobacter xixiisoli]SOD14251.1 small subunit ribosomal protein S15 [Pedobacter xixiisoli]
MYLSTEKKAEIFAKHGEVATNTGSAEGQVALFTYRIAHLTEHLKKNRKDFSTQLALQKLVGKRRGILAYLHKKDINRYRAIIKALSLRDIIKSV